MINANLSVDDNIKISCKDKSLILSVNEKLCEFDTSILNPYLIIESEKFIRKFINDNDFSNFYSLKFLKNISNLEDIEVRNYFLKNLVNKFQLLYLLIHYLHKFKTNKRIVLKIDDLSLFFLNKIEIFVNYKNKYKIEKKYYLFYKLCKIILFPLLFTLSLFNLFNLKIMNYNVIRDKDKTTLVEIFPSDFGFNKNDNINNDWFIKKDNLKKITFYSEIKLDEKYKTNISKRKIDFLYLSSKFMIFNSKFNFRLKTFIYLSRNLNKLYRDFLITDSSLTLIYINALYQTYKWLAFTDEIKNSNINSLICYQGFRSSNIIRNSILRKFNIKTFRYDHSLNFTWFQQSSDNFNKLYKSFTNYYLEFHLSKINYLASSNDSLSSSYSHQQILPPFTMALEPRDYFLNKINNIKKRNFKIITLFPTSYHKNSSNNLSDVIYFIEMMFFLIKQNKNIHIFYKDKSSSKNIFSNSFLNKKFKDKLNKNSKNINIVNNDAGLLIKHSDITISMPFGTTFIESVLLNKISFFFDYNNRWNKSIYHKYDKILFSDFDKISMTINEYISNNNFDQINLRNKKIKDLFFDTKATNLKDILNMILEKKYLYKIK